MHSIANKSRGEAFALQGHTPTQSNPRQSNTAIVAHVRREWEFEGRGEPNRAMRDARGVLPEGHWAATLRRSTNDAALSFTCSRLWVWELLRRGSVGSIRVASIDRHKHLPGDRISATYGPDIPWVGIGNYPTL